MFEFFKNKENNSDIKKCEYTMGLTFDGRVQVVMVSPDGTARLTMDKTGVQQFIDQLEFFKGKLSPNKEHET